jgi:alpha-beta hydrolase superfamily lysophospholipase
VALMRRLAVTLAVSFGIALVAASVAVAWVFGPDIVNHFKGASAESSQIPTAHIGGSQPGSLVSATTMTELDKDPDSSLWKSARVLYHSTNGDTGQSTVVSGSVYVPKAQAPAGGWPVMAFGHGTTGIDEPCAPSLSPKLLNMTVWVTSLIKRGYAVAFADYQGLGAPGVHPYTDNKTEGLNIIDSVRALRHTFPDVSNRWAAFGGSQGGGAVWAADEQAGAYAPDLDLVGVVAMSPAADVSGIVDKAMAQTLTTDQAPAWFPLVEVLARLHPDFNRDDYRGGAAAKYWDILTSCSGPKSLDRNAAAAELKDSDLMPRTPEAADRMRTLLRQWALPQQRITAPLSILYGGQDTLIDPQWTTDAIARACALGGPIVWDLQPDKGHGNIDISTQFGWLADRFAGKPVASECP